MHFLKSLGLAVTAAAGLSLAAMPAHAEWPDGPITMLIGYKAGGGTDTKGRVLAKQLGQELGVPVKVINKPGGGQAAALNWFKELPADGKVFFFGASTGITLNPHLKKNIGYSKDDYEYCCLVTEFQPAMVAPADAPFDDWAGFIAHSKANPGVKYAALSPFARIIMELIAKKEGLDVNYIPTKGGAGMVQLVLGKQVMAAYSGGIHSRYPGKFKTLAVITSARQAHFPNAPTLEELNYGLNGDAPTVVAFPKGIDPAIVAKLAAAMKVAAASKDMANISKKIMMPVNYADTEAAKKFIDGTTASFGKMIKDSGYVAK
jgi:tripartite-type tricarboxylate transporter receptor subunit TctC